MVAGCGNKCVKGCVIFFNFTFCALGAAILAISLWVRFDNDFQKYLQDFLDKSANSTVNLQNLYIALYVLAAVGGLLFITGFLGCCGAACESSCLLGLFFTIILLLFCAELAAGIYVIVKRDDIKNMLATFFKDEVVSKYGTDADITKGLKELFVKMSCCGANGAADLGARAIEACGVTAAAQPGCWDLIWKDIENNVNIIGGVALAILGVELLGMIFCLILCCAIRQGPYGYA